MNSAVLKTLENTEAIRIGIWAYEALLEEVYTTPKPGLVDTYSRGAHEDMDVHTFEKSARALLPYFVRMTQQGLKENGPARKVFDQIRKTGIAAEKAMYRATGGVNTHKGAVFSMGIYCAAAGRCLAEYGDITEARLRNIQIEMTEETLRKEILLLGKKDAVSHGEINYRNYGTTGVRGEAAKGYPSLWNTALPVFRQGIREGRCLNLVKLQTLFALMCCMEDSNIIARHNLEVLQKVQREARRFLARGGAYREQSSQELVEMDKEYTRKNISPGGCADLLAAVIFIEKLLNKGIV